jgi:cytokinin riboside 5'-monophosphate phosphoribohydrolase
MKRTTDEYVPVENVEMASDVSITTVAGDENNGKNPIGAVCVYSSSSDALPGHYFDAARELAELMARHRYKLIFGAGRIGLMGEMARTLHRQGGKVMGVIPEYLNLPNIAYHEADELVVTPDMRQRKALMEEHADAFIGLPGGFGTLEEILEVITLKQVQQHNKPVVLLNIDGFYEDLINMFERIYRDKFAKTMHRKLYHVAGEPGEAIEYINRYTPVPFPKKWF